MDQQRQRIQDDLRGLVRGDVACDEVSTRLYASDASIYERAPTAILRPRSTADVANGLRYAAEQKIPVRARGAGTGLAGESLGEGLVIDFSRYMRRVIRTDPEQVRVQPGLVLARLNDHLRHFGRLFGPDPANSSVTTLGSVIAIDAGGSHWLQYGSARRHIESLEIVLASGEILEVGREPIHSDAEDSSHATKRTLVRRVANLLERNAELIERYRPKTLVNQSGYNLTDAIVDGHLHLARLLAGSEGTLALVTEATLATQPLPKYRGVGLLFFSSLENAALAVQELLPFQPVACDLLDRRHLSLAREADVRYDLILPAAAEAMLLVEHAGDDLRSVEGQLSSALDHVRKKRRLAFDSLATGDREEIDLYWQLARRATPTLHRVQGAARPLPFVEDLAIPPSALPEFLLRLQNTLKKRQVTASLYGHVGHGQLHVRPFLDLNDLGDVQKLDLLAGDLYDEALQIGGTISGEHGDGISRTPFLRQQYGELYEVFRELKDIFDPLGILNPGKIIGDQRQSLVNSLRPPGLAPSLSQSAEAQNGEASVGVASPLESPPSQPPPLLVAPLQLLWTPLDVLQEARSCNGCGACRSQLSDVRMCPIFRVAPGEEASPRAKANLMRAIWTGTLPFESLATEEVKSIADLCVNCHQCRLECPSQVDIPKLMIEAKAAYVDRNGLKPSDWLLARLDLVGIWGSRLGPIANWAISNRQFRWLFEKFFGIARNRKLPRFARRTFLRRAARRRLTRPTRRSDQKVLYFVDTYANFFDPQLGDALVAVFEHNGVAVYVHPDQRASGMASITAGALDTARRLAAHNLPLLAEAVRQGYQIVTTEPSTTLCLTREYRHLIDDDDARLVAENTSDACGYLWKLHQQGKLRLDLKPVNGTVGYHLPCMTRALQIGSPGENLLRLIAGLNVQRIEKGCSGMAGSFGLKKENFRTSLRAGWGLISSLREPGLQAGTSECSACKMQMEQGAAKSTIHPLKLLALAYGNLPEVAALLTSRPDDAFIS